jgi:hypothetical protein
MTEHQQQPTPPATATAASARLETLKADAGWRDRVMAGDVAAKKELTELTTMIAAGGDAVDQAIAGVAGTDAEQRQMTEAAAWMRQSGISDGVIKQTLSDYEVSSQEYRAVEAWKAQKMRSPEFTKAFLVGEPEAVRQMRLADIVLSSSIKAEVA